jgi:RNA polymerase sigma-70 factor (ECF subfamily)
MLSTELPRASAMAGEDLLAGLIARVAAGDEAALRALYERSAGRLFAICLRIVRDPAAAETVLAQTYAGIWRRARSFDPTHGSALAWMIAQARQQAIEAVRSRPRDLGVLGDAAIDNLEGRIALAGLRRSLSEIEEPARRAVLLAYRDGLSYAELGAVLGVPADTARTWVSRALMTLRQSLDDADG